MKGGRYPHQVAKRIEAWLDRMGWTHHPFAQPDDLAQPITAAEAEQDLGQYFLGAVVEIGVPTDAVVEETEPQDDIGRFEDLLDANHCVLFAEPGEGKTATRLMVASEARKYNILVVGYTHFDGPPRTTDQHAYEMGLCILRTLEKSKEAKLETAILEKDIQSLTQLTEISRAVTGNGFEAVFMLIDNVEEGLGVEWTIGDLEAKIKNLFDARLLRIPGLRLKFFIPMELAEKVCCLPVVRHRRFNVRRFHLRWTKARLQRLLFDRISHACSRDGSLPSADKNGLPFDIDNRLVEVSLSQSGGPRNLNILVCSLIRVHARSELDPNNITLTRQDFEEAIREFGTGSVRKKRLSFNDLYGLLLTHYDLEELRTLCARLGVPYDNLRGEGLQAKARELVLWMQRHRSLAELEVQVITAQSRQ